MSKIILIHLACTFFMVGAIWIIQLLHYPSFDYFVESSFSERMKWHQVRISWVVIPIMLLELLTGIWICWKLSFGDLVWNINLGCLLLVWVSTFVFQGPTHQKLLAGYSREKILFLVRTNWIRTALWTLRFTMLIFFMM